MGKTWNVLRTQVEGGDVEVFRKVFHIPSGVDTPQEEVRQDIGMATVLRIELCFLLATAALEETVKALRHDIHL